MLNDFLSAILALSPEAAILSAIALGAIGAFAMMQGTEPSGRGFYLAFFVGYPCVIIGTIGVTVRLLAAVNLGVGTNLAAITAITFVLAGLLVRAMILPKQVRHEKREQIVAAGVQEAVRQPAENIFALPQRRPALATSAGSTVARRRPAHLTSRKPAVSTIEHDRMFRWTGTDNG